MPTLTLLPWNKPLLPQVTDRLWGEGDGYTGLTRTLVVVPTRGAGRRLREALGVRAAEWGRGLVLPEIITAGALLTYGLRVERLADAGSMAAIWAATLAEANPALLQPLFGESGRTRGDSLHLIRQLIELQQTLAEGDLDFRAVAERVSDDSLKEPARWQALAQLEADWEVRLGRTGLISPFAAQRDASASGPDLSRVILAGVTDLSPLARKVLSGWESAGKELEIWCWGESLEHFDAWGRPRPDVFAVNSFPVIDESGSISVQVYVDPSSGAAAVANLAQAYRLSPGAMGLAVADAASAPILTSALIELGEAAHDPAGRPLSESLAGSLVLQLLDLAATGSFDAGYRLLRHPAAAKFLLEGGGLSLLRAVDELCYEHLPSALEDVGDHLTGEFRTLHPVWQKLVSWQESLKSPPYSEVILSILRACFSHWPLDPNEGAFREAAEGMAECLRRTAQLERVHRGLPGEFWRKWIAQSLADTRVPLERTSGAWELQGWIELFFEESPHLVIFGLNEGFVPEAVVGHPFLPESLRAFLGLKTNPERHARDAHLLAALARSRLRNGRVDMLVFKQAADGTPRLPSRLLFQGSDDYVLERGAHVFAEQRISVAQPRRTVPWKLHPERILRDKPLVLSPSQISAYLQCPFRYFLKHRLKMEELPVQPREMDALQFGSLCHDVLATLQERELQDAGSAEEIFALLKNRLDRLARARFGSRPTLSLQLQLAAIASRLLAASHIEALNRSEGWVVRGTELEWELQMEGARFRGRIDRIDFNSATGGWRVIDYKTSSSGQIPEKKHLTSYRAPDPWILPESAHPNGTKRWTDLQLPLYIQALRMGSVTPALGGLTPDAPVIGGYFNLPDAAEDTGVRVWEIDPATQDSAVQTSLAVFRAITSGRFWPPAPISERMDPYRRLFPNGILDDVNPSELIAQAAPGV